MSDLKICPKLTSGNEGFEWYCEEEHCAWWMHQECAMITIADALFIIAEGEV